ncbi:hypothetical protein ERO13_D12G096750v2, partial [Gossypium hirsutum]
IFLALRGYVQELQAKMRRMWWACKDKRRGWAMLTWDKVCLSKGMGGLGFRDIRLFNIALLGRQVWKLLTVKDTLCYNVLSSKYFPDGDLFHSKKVEKPSFTWNSIAIAARDLKDGFGWQIGNGGKIDIHKDNW